MPDKGLAEFIGNPVLIKELQINQSYAMVFTPSEEGEEGIMDVAFHSLLRMPSPEEMQSELFWQPEGQSIIFMTMLYIDEAVWLFRSLVNDNTITVNRTTNTMVDVKQLT